MRYIHLVFGLLFLLVACGDDTPSYEVQAVIKIYDPVVADDLGVSDYPSHAPAELISDSLVLRAARASGQTDLASLQKWLSAEFYEDQPGMISVRLRGEDPTAMMEFLNTLLEVFIEQEAAVEKLAHQHALATIDDLLDSVAVEINSLEQEIKERAESEEVRMLTELEQGKLKREIEIGQAVIAEANRVKDGLSGSSDLTSIEVPYGLADLGLLSSHLGSVQKTLEKNEFDSEEEKQSFVTRSRRGLERECNRLITHYEKRLPDWEEELANAEGLNSEWKTLEKMYSFLLERRANETIAMAGYVSPFRIIYPAHLVAEEE